MHRATLIVLLLAGAFALAGCRGTETADNGRDLAPASPPPSEAPAPAPAIEPGIPAPAEEPVIGGSASEPVADPAGRPPAAPPAQPSPPRAEADAPAAPAPSASQAEQILQRSEQAYRNMRSMEADFVQHLSVPLLGTNQQSRGKFYQRRPDRILLRFTDPAGDIIVADGRHFWMYYPSSDRTQVLRSRMSEGGAQVDLHQEFLSNATERFVATLDGEETVGGRAAHVLTLVPRTRSPYRQVRVWVDRSDHLVRRFEITEENESLRRFELRDLKLNVNLPDSLFQFTPPPGTQVFDQ